MREPHSVDTNARRCQKNYRSLLQAFSRPGRIVRLERPTGMSPFATALIVAECLLDSEVSFCAIGNGGTQALHTAIGAATGVRPEPLSGADFIFVCGNTSHGGLRVAKRGFPECPEQGATFVYYLDSRPAGAGDRFRVRLTGPGIPEAAGIAPEMDGVPIDEYQELGFVNADYPLGVDAFFVRPSGELIGVPRSTRIQIR